jgi:hypothetical protein
MAQKVDAAKQFMWINQCAASRVLKGKNLHYVFRPGVHSDQYGTASCTFLNQNSDRTDGYWTSLTTEVKDDAVFRKDSRNRFEVPAKERRAFSVNIATLLAGGTGAGWPIVNGKFLPGAYRFKFRWAGKESPEFSLTIMPK